MLPAMNIAWRDIRWMHRASTQTSTDFFGSLAKAHRRAESFSQDVIQSRPFSQSANRRTLGWTEIRAVLRRPGKILDMQDLYYPRAIYFGRPSLPFIRPLPEQCGDRQPSWNASSKGYYDDVG